MSVLLIAYVLAVPLGVGYLLGYAAAEDHAWRDRCAARSGPGWPLRFRVIGRTR